MPTTYYAPGVYIEEPDRGAKPIQGVSTSVTAFIGFTKKAEKLQDNSDYLTRSILGEPTLVTSWAQFEKYFGSYDENAYLPYSVRGFFDNGGSRCYIISVRTTEAHKAQALVNVLLKKDDKDKGKEIPGLVVLAKNGGTVGNNFQLKVTPVQNNAGAVATPGDPASSTSKPKPLFQISVRDGGSGNFVSLKNVRQKNNGRATVSVDELRKRVETLRQAQTDKQKEVDALKQKWQREGVDLTVATDAQWEQVKKNCLDRPSNTVTGAELDTARQQHKQLSSDLSKLQSDLPAAEQTFQQAEQAEAAAQREGWKFAMDDLPVWGERDRKEQQEVADSQSDLVQVWRIHKRGKEAEAQPVSVQDLRLEGGRLSIDHLFLEEEKLITKAESDAAAENNGATLFKEKASLLYQGNEAKRRGIDGFYAFDDINLVCAPDIMKAYELMEDRTEADTIVKAIQESILTFCKRAHYPFAILDAPPKMDVQTINEWRMGLSYGDTMYGALYYPWIKIADPFNAGRQIAIPPSGHMAGIYARSDSQRGVHKAPANETISGALDLTVNVTKAEQELLNPNGVNCIRKFPGRGIRVWGARTLAMTDPSWRYINVRRLFSYVEASVERNTQWVVFEPNDFMLWAKVRRDVTAFLRTVWLSGALFGVTPEQAFYVKCDEETNPTELRDLGQMVCEIGMAPVKPAEFVIFRFSQWAGQEA